MAKSRKTQRRNRKMNGGQAPVNYSNPGPMGLSLGQGVDFERYHSGQHGGMGPYPASVSSSSLPADLNASARINPTLQAYAEIRGLKDQAGGRRGRSSRKSRKSRRKSRKNSRKSRKASRKNRRNGRRQNGGDFVRWGGGGYNSDVDAPMTIGESSKMLIPPNLQAQAGLHPEWKDAANPNALTPK